ncbi:hypothetical protein HPB47_026907 [Ixodes persulcatus]|uniref:Uncharacterized protein n=1 Tax=Ixodes persulcatus TaxID=34615 RepID=A0AC60PXC8_IXOPE|nr:hypothetical protein HPB47_026907 [Ixodes persulcatus]
MEEEKAEATVPPTMKTFMSMLTHISNQVSQLSQQVNSLTAKLGQANITNWDRLRRSADSEGEDEDQDTKTYEAWAKKQRTESCEVPSAASSLDCLSLIVQSLSGSLATRGEHRSQLSPVKPRPPTLAK